MENYQTGVMLECASHVKLYADRIKVIDKAIELIDSHTKGRFTDTAKDSQSAECQSIAYKLVLEKVKLELAQWVGEVYPRFVAVPITKEEYTRKVKKAPKKPIQ